MPPTPDVPRFADAGSRGDPAGDAGAAPSGAPRRRARATTGPTSGRDIPTPRSAKAAGAPDHASARTSSRPPRRTVSRAPLSLATAVAVLWAAFVSYLPVALALSLAQFAHGETGVIGAARIGLAGWVLGHGVPLTTPAGPISLIPMAVTAIAAWRVARAGVHVTRALGARNSRSIRRSMVVAAAVGVGYGLLGALAALAAGTATVTASPLRAGITFAVFGAAASVVGALRTTGAWGEVARRIPVSLRRGLRTGLVAGILVCGAGAGAAGLAVALSGGEASDMIAAYRTGVVGQAGITVISAGYAPNAAIWAAAYLLGPGFAVGTDTTVTTTEVMVGALPAVPLLAALPNGPVGDLGAALLLAVPVLAGMMAGWLLGRRWQRAARRDNAPVSWIRVFTAAAISGPASGVVLGVAAWVSSGSLGDARMTQLGPVAWQVGAAATLLVTVGALIGVAATRALPLSDSGDYPD